MVESSDCIQVDGWVGLLGVAKDWDWAAKWVVPKGKQSDRGMAS